MKKLRMIATSVIVLTIVGGVFAFKTKIGTYCIRTGGPGNCTTIKHNIKLTTGIGTTYWYWPTWDGNPTLCTQDMNMRCVVQAKFTLD